MRHPRIGENVSSIVPDRTEETDGHGTKDGTVFAQEIKSANTI